MTTPPISPTTATTTPTPLSQAAKAAVPVLVPFTLLDTTMREEAVWELSPKTLFLGENMSYKSAPVHAARAAYLRTVRARNASTSNDLIDLSAKPSMGWRAELKGPSGEAVFICPQKGDTIRPPLTGALAIAEATRGEACVTDIGDEILSGRSAKARELLVRGLSGEVDPALCVPLGLTKDQEALWEQARMLAKSVLGATKLPYTEGDVLTELTDIARKRKRASTAEQKTYADSVAKARTAIDGMQSRAVAPEILAALAEEKTQLTTLIDARPLVERMQQIGTAIASAQSIINHSEGSEYETNRKQLEAAISEVKLRELSIDVDCISAQLADVKKREERARVMHEVGVAALAAKVCPFTGKSIDLDLLRAKVQMLSERQVGRAAELQALAAQQTLAEDKLRYETSAITQAHATLKAFVGHNAGLLADAKRQLEQLEREKTNLAKDQRWLAWLQLPAQVQAQLQPMSTSTTSVSPLTDVKVFTDRLAIVNTKLSNAETTTKHRSEISKATTAATKAEGEAANWKVVEEAAVRTQIRVMEAEREKIIERVQAYLPSDLRLSIDFGETGKKIEFGLIGRHGRRARIGGLSGREEASLVIALGAWLSPSPFRLALPDDVGLGMFDSKEILNYFEVLGHAVDAGRIHQVVGAWNRPGELMELEQRGWKVHYRQSLPPPVDMSSISDSSLP